MMIRLHHIHWQNTWMCPPPHHPRPQFQQVDAFSLFCAQNYCLQNLETPDQLIWALMVIVGVRFEALWVKTPCCHAWIGTFHQWRFHLQCEKFNKASFSTNFKTFSSCTQWSKIHYQLTKEIFQQKKSFFSRSRPPITILRSYSAECKSWKHRTICQNMQTSQIVEKMESWIGNAMPNQFQLKKWNQTCKLRRHKWNERQNICENTHLKVKTEACRGANTNVTPTHLFVSTNSVSIQKSNQQTIQNKVQVTRAAVQLLLEKWGK